MLEIDAELKSSFAGEVVTALERVFDYLLAMALAEGNGADTQLSFSEVRAAKQVPDDRQLLFRERVALIAQILEPLGDVAREQVVRVLSQIAGQAASHRAALLARSEAGVTAPSQAGTRS